MRVALFVACFNDALFPGTGQAVVTLLERLGHEVTFPSAQTCCGQMHWNTGYHREAAGLARRFTEIFARHDVVVTPSASCATTVREAYPRMARSTGDSVLRRDAEVLSVYDYHARLTGSAAETRADVIALFTDRIADYRAAVRHAGADELATTVAAALWGREAKSIVVPPDLPYGWLAQLDGVQALADSPVLDLDALDSVDGVVTGCAVAIAQTGTIVLDGGRAQGRRVLTLVPDYHLCVVHADQIVGTVPEAIARLDPYRSPYSRPLTTWISGPSATSDIELDRVEGVHGPRTLEVLIVED